MRLALVGNGPSAADRGPHIDAHDFVVRFNAFPVVGARGAGTKLSAWCWFGNHTSSELLAAPPTGDYEVWASLPPSKCLPYSKTPVGDVRRVIDWAYGRAIRWVGEDQWHDEEAHLQASPTTGFTAVTMALDLLAPESITLYGFDATVKGAPGYQDARPSEHLVWSEGHSYEREKLALVELRDKGHWLGQPVKTKLFWPCCPVGGAA